MPVAPHAGTDTTGASAATPRRARRPALVLTLATVGFALNFWAWALLSPLAPRFEEALGLTALQQALVVAVPVVVGSLGRIPVGALTDRYGARVMFPLVSFATILPVLYLGLAGTTTYAGLITGGFFLGIGGTAFAVGVPLVGAWFPPHRRGLAIGVFGVGTGGAAVSALTTVELAAADIRAPFLLTAALLAVYGVVAAVLLRDAPGRVVSAEPVLGRLAATLRLPVTWQTSALYAVGFGGFVGFSVYLPTYLAHAYGLAPTDAAHGTAAFVLLAVVMRPVGGWLSDRLHPARVLLAAFAVVVVAALVQAGTPGLVPLGSAAFLSMAAAFGAAAGATFGLVALLAPQDRVGAVTGVVGAAGGLGGLVPPLLMGAVYGRYGGHGPGLLGLAAVAAAVLVLALRLTRRHPWRPVPA